MKKTKVTTSTKTVSKKVELKQLTNDEFGTVKVVSTADGDGFATGTIVGKGDEFVFGKGATNEFGDAGRHADAMVEGFHCCNAFEGSLFGVFEVVAHSEYVDCKLGKASDVFVHDISSPTAPEGCKSCSVSNSEHSGEFVFESVSGKVFLCATFGEVVMCQGTAPHNLGTELVVFRVVKYFLTTFLDCAK